MGKKYYFRGLGLGIIVTALIMGIALSHGGKKEITDAEVIARAKELGMIENTTLLEPTEDDEDQEKAEPAAEQEPAEPVKKDVAVAQPKDDAVAKPEDDGEDASAKQPADHAEGKSQEDPAVQEKPKSQEGTTSKNTTQNKKPQTGTNEMTKQDEDTGQKAPVETESSGQKAASVTIVSGDGSYTVAKKLEAAGVVSSASAYDDYLCQNGYDKRLRTGTFQIPSGADDEQIAKIVTGQP